MEQPIIEVKDVYKKFCKNLKRSMMYGLQDIFKPNHIDEQVPTLRKGEFWALRGVNLTISKGEAVGIIGMNGAGKTTMIRAIMGSYPVSYGEININGRMTTVFERARAFQKFYSGEENIRIKGSLFGITNTEMDDLLPKIVEFAGIEDFANSPFGTYSAGMRSRMNFALALFARPDLLVIDEGLAVSDVHFRRKCMDAIKQKKEDMGVMLVSHNLEQFEELATRLVIMDHGRVIAETDDIAYGLKQVMDKKIIQHV